MAIDRLAAAGDELAGGARVNHLAVLDHADREAGHAVMRDDVVDGAVVRGGGLRWQSGRRRRCRTTRYEQKDYDVGARHAGECDRRVARMAGSYGVSCGVSFHCGVITSSATRSSNAWRRRITAQRPSSTSTSAASGREL